LIESYKKILGDSEFIYVDIGSRGGLSDEWDKVKDIIKVVLFEPDEEEATKLKMSLSDGTTVIPKAVWNQRGTVKFHCTRNPSYGSVLEPNVSTLEGSYYYCRNFYVVDKEINVEADTLENLLHQYGVNQLDFLKIDVQGGENFIFSSIKRWDEILGVYTEAYADELYKDGANISSILHFLNKKELKLYNLLKIAHAPIVEVDGLDMFSEELLSARPISGYKPRPMVFDLLLFKDKLSVLKSESPEYARKMIFCLCIYEYFDYAIFLLIKFHNNKILSLSEKNEILKSIKNIHSHTLSKYQLFKERIKSKSYKLLRR